MSQVDYNKEKNYIKKIMSRQKPGYEPTTQDVINMINKKKDKGSNKEHVDLKIRNFMIPSYHKKTHFKGALSLQM